MLNIIFIILASVWFLVLYFYFIPKLLIKKLAHCMELQNVSYKSYIQPVKDFFHISGNLSSHSVHLYLMPCFIIPVINILIRPDKDREYNMYFLEEFNRDIFQSKDITGLKSQINSIYIYQSGSRHIISKILNKRVRDIFIKFIKNRILLEVHGSFIYLRYRFIFNFFLFLRMKYFKNLIKDSIRLSEYLLTENNAELIIENTIEENDEDLITINLMLLYNEKRSDESRKLFMKYEGASNKILSIAAKCGLGKETFPDIEFLIKNVSTAAKIFAIENMPAFNLTPDEKIELLKFSIYQYDYRLLEKAFNSLFKSAPRRTEKILREYISRSRQINKESGYLNIRFLTEFIAEHKFLSCFDFIVRCLEECENEEGTENLCINAFIKFGDIRAVDCLLPLTTGEHTNRIKQKARTAINELQKNIPPDQRGALSFSKPGEEGGELSVSEEEEN